MLLKGYNALVTGATSGMGLAMVKDFIEQGASVIGAGRNFSKTQDLGEQFIPCVCDVTDEEQIKASYRLAEDKFGKLDILVCNAGRFSLPGVDTLESSELDEALSILLRAPMLFTKTFTPLLRKSDHPSILNTCSIGSFAVAPANVAYYVAKSGLFNYTKHSAAQLKGIRVNAICPGFIKTNIVSEEVWSLWNQVVFPNIPISRVGEDWEIAKLATFLSSPKARFITGAGVLIDGGYTTINPSAVAKL